MKLLPYRIYCWNCGKETVVEMPEGWEQDIEDGLCSHKCMVEWCKENNESSN